MEISSPYNNQNPNPQNVPKKSTSILSIVVIIAFLILTGMVAAFFYITNKDKVELSNQLLDLQKNEEKNNLENNFSNTNFDEAITYGESLIEKYPEDISNYILLANSYLQKGSITFNEIENADKAIEILEEAILIDSRNSEVYRVMGYAYEIKQDYKTAKNMYDTSIDIDSNNDVAYGARGHMYYLIGNDNLAEADLKKALEINPNNDKAIIDLAAIYFRSGNTVVDAEELILRAISISDNNNVKAEAFQVLGSLYFSKSEYQKAEAQFRQAIKFEERLAMAWVGLATSRIMLLETVSDESFDSSVREIVDSIETALTLNENLSRAYVAEALISGYLGDFVAEKEAYQKALDSIEKDITLSRNEKTELKIQVQALINEL